MKWLSIDHEVATKLVPLEGVGEQHLLLQTMPEAEPLIRYAHPKENLNDVHVLLSFLDAYLGYNQISMYLPDEPKTAFIIPYDMFFYKVMSVELKNVGATY